MMLKRSRLALLTEPNFRRFFTGSVTSLLGDGMTSVALPLAVLDLTKSSADVGYVLSARSVPMLAALLFGGVIADRFPRRAVMIAADGSRFAGQGATAALLLSGHARIWELFLPQAVSGVATAVFNPAVTGLMSSIVVGDRLQQANALRGLASSIGYIAGPALAGGVIAVSSPAWAVAANAATFAVSASQLARLKLAAHQRLRAQPFLRDVRDGWDELRSRTWLWAFISFSSVNNMCYAAFLVLGPAVVQSHDEPAAWAGLVVALGAGSLVGGTAALHLRPGRPLRTATLAVVLFSGPVIGLAAQAPVIVLAGLCLLAGAGTTVSNSLTQTVLQRHVKQAAQSRISAFMLLGSLAVQPIGQAGAGPMAAAIGVYPVLWLAGSVQLLSALATLAVPAIRGLPARPAQAGA